MASAGRGAASKDGSASIDPAKAWIIGEVDDDSEPVVRVVPSPEALIGTAYEARQRVVKLSLGCEHGVLLTDAGIACTWGDNRYGQLGRRPCHKEENGQPYPVLALQDEELIGVAAGRHHCLALTATGLVWAWGRNKHGQLGCGDNRDKVLPVEVGKAPNAEGVCEQLGSGEGRIVAIAAGMNSSTAAAANSDIWQWGEINSDFKDQKEAKADRWKQAEDVAPRSVPRNRPHNVLDVNMYRSGLREKRVSITELACRVIPRGEDRGRVRDLVESVVQLQGSIQKERQEIIDLDNARKAEPEKRSAGRGEGGDRNDQQELQDTIATLEMQIANVNREIETLKKNMQSCEMQQAHDRLQIQSLMQQGTQLSNIQDDYSVKYSQAKRGSSERKKLEEQLAEIKAFVEANQNTRTTLLDQRADTDKEKQQLTSELARNNEKCELLKRRLETVRDFGRSFAASGSGASDSAMQFLQEEPRLIARQFDGRKLDTNFVDAKQSLERHYRFLDESDRKSQDLVENSSSGGSRVKKVALLIRDITQLRRELSEIQDERWLKDDLDVSSFFTRPEKEKEKTEMLAIKE